MIRVLVCGGRDMWDERPVVDALEELSPSVVITGGASGCDELAARWAEKSGVPLMIFPAPWARFSRKAGPIRNGWMIKYGRPDLVLQFPGGKGTANMAKQARDAGIEVREIPK